MEKQNKIHIVSLKRTCKKNQEALKTQQNKTYKMNLRELINLEGQQ
jgi:hypothetical protein